MIIDTDELREMNEEFQRELPEVLRRNEPDPKKRYEWVVLWETIDMLIKAVEEFAPMIQDAVSAIREEKREGRWP